MGDSNEKPVGELALKTMAMPGDANPNGDIFGGWVLAQMDLAGGIVACRRAPGRVATVAVAAMRFHKPVLVGDVLCCHAEVGKIGTTSMTIQIQAWAIHFDGGELIKVTEGDFVYVAITDEGRPRPVEK
jgi:acyl-CoA thioesterase YciA